jgi:hypothetical protein
VWLKKNLYPIIHTIESKSPDIGWNGSLILHDLLKDILIRFFIPREHFVPERGYRNAFRPSVCTYVRLSVRTGSDLRDGSWDHYETLGYLGVPVWDDARHFYPPRARRA